jgi:hypothetical protein
MFLEGICKPLYSLSGESRFVKRSLWVGIAIGLSLAAMPFGPARADTALDMATFTCQDWLDASDDERDLMLVWLRGYLGGRAGTSLYYPDATRTDRTKMEIYCRAHLAIGVISAMGLLLH